MVETSSGWKSAVNEAVRRTRVRIPARIADPDTIYGPFPDTSHASWSQNSQVADGDFSGAGDYATGEMNRWVLGRSQSMLSSGSTGEIGYVSGVISGTDGVFSTAPQLDVGLTNVDTLRAVTIQFPEAEADGFAVDFTVWASANWTVLESVTVTGNTQRRVLVPFAVAEPDTITVVISKWSLPSRRARIVEIYAGYAVDWTERDITDLSLNLQCSLSTMQQPYSTATVTLDNTGGAFNPLDKSSMFQAIEEGQGFPIEIGVDVNGETEYVPLGTFYHHNQGWSQQNNNMTMRFSLVDIIGLLADVDFTVPETMPTTLDGWLSAIVDCLGPQFSGHYAFDPDYLAEYEITADAEAVSGKTCTNVLQLLCQASGCIGITQRSTGYLLMRSTVGVGLDVTLDNLDDYPVFSANDYLGSLTFRLPDGEGGTTEYKVYGEDNTTRNTSSVNNPFIVTESGAQAVAENIFSAYGGNRIALRGRGDPSAELGDAITVETKEGFDASGRILSQTFSYADGVLSGCRTDLLHTQTRYNAYAHRVVFTEDGTWTVPEGVETVHIVLVGGGDGGGYGVKYIEELYTPQQISRYRTEVWQHGEHRSDGTWEYNETYTWGQAWNMPDGEVGRGGKVLSTEVSVNPGANMAIVIGQGGAASALGTHTATAGTATTFGSHSSATGLRYDGAYTDIYAGGSYAKSGQSTGKANSGNGGAAGKGSTYAEQMVAYTLDYDSRYDQYTTRNLSPWRWITGFDPARSGDGTSGTAGSSGICIIYYNDPS